MPHYLEAEVQKKCTDKKYKDMPEKFKSFLDQLAQVSEDVFKSENLDVSKFPKEPFIVNLDDNPDYHSETYKNNVIKIINNTCRFVLLDLFPTALEINVDKKSAWAYTPSNLYKAGKTAYQVKKNKSGIDLNQYTAQMQYLDRIDNSYLPIVNEHTIEISKLFLLLLQTINNDVLVVLKNDSIRQLISPAVETFDARIKKYEASIQNNSNNNQQEETLQIIDEKPQTTENTFNDLSTQTEDTTMPQANIANNSSDNTNDPLPMSVNVDVDSISIKKEIELISGNITTMKNQINNLKQELEASSVPSTASQDNSDKTSQHSDDSDNSFESTNTSMSSYSGKSANTSKSKSGKKSTPEIADLAQLQKILADAIKDEETSQKSPKTKSPKKMSTDEIRERLKNLIKRSYKVNSADKNGYKNLLTDLGYTHIPKDDLDTKPFILSLKLKDKKPDYLTILNAIKDKVAEQLQADKTAQAQPADISRTPSSQSLDSQSGGSSQSAEISQKIVELETALSEAENNLLKKQAELTAIDNAKIQTWEAFKGLLTQINIAQKVFETNLTLSHSTQLTQRTAVVKYDFAHLTTQFTNLQNALTQLGTLSNTEKSQLEAELQTTIAQNIGNIAKSLSQKEPSRNNQSLVEFISSVNQSIQNPLTNHPQIYADHSQAQLTVSLVDDFVKLTQAVQLNTETADENVKQLLDIQETAQNLIGNAKTAYAKIVHEVDERNAINALKKQEEDSVAEVIRGLVEKNDRNLDKNAIKQITQTPLKHINSIFTSLIREKITDTELPRYADEQIKNAQAKVYDVLQQNQTPRLNTALKVLGYLLAPLGVGFLILNYLNKSEKQEIKEIKTTAADLKAQADLMNEIKQSDKYSLENSANNITRLLNSKYAETSMLKRQYDGEKPAENDDSNSTVKFRAGYLQAEAFKAKQEAVDKLKHATKPEQEEKIKTELVEKLNILRK